MRKRINYLILVNLLCVIESTCMSNVTPLKRHTDLSQKHRPAAPKPVSRLTRGAIALLVSLALMLILLCTMAVWVIYDHL